MKELKKNFIALVEAYKDDDTKLAMIEKAMNSLSEYVDAVYGMETNMFIVRFRYEGEEVRERITAMDTHRRRTHDAAIVYVNILSRMADMAGVPRMFTGTTDESDFRYDRNVIGDFCIDAVNAFFKDREKYTKVSEMVQKVLDDEAKEA